MNIKERSKKEGSWLGTFWAEFVFSPCVCKDLLYEAYLLHSMDALPTLASQRFVSFSDLEPVIFLLGHYIRTIGSSILSVELNVAVTLSLWQLG